MHLSDGTEVTDEGVYRVQFAKGDYTPENEAEDSAEEQEMTPDQIYSAYLDTVDTIAPPEVPER